MTLSGELWKRQGPVEREDCTIILSKIRRGTAQSHLNKKSPFLRGWMALLILHTIGVSLHLSHCRIEIALLIKDPLELICQGKKWVISPIFFISISNHVLSFTYYYSVLFQLLWIYLTTKRCRQCLTGSHRKAHSQLETICGAIIVLLQVGGELGDVVCRDSQLFHISGTRSKFRYVCPTKSIYSTHLSF